MVSGALAAEPEREYFVAPDGDDGNPGTKAEPFATLEAARDAVRGRQRSPTQAGPITIWVRGGAYRRTKAFTLTREDSGTKDAPIVYRAFPNEWARLVGGVALKSEWFGALKDQTVRDRLKPAVRAKILQANLRTHGVQDLGKLDGYRSSLQLFCGARRLPLARWPDEGEWAHASRGKVTGLDEEGRPVVEEAGDKCHTMGFAFDGRPPAKWHRYDDVWLRGYWWELYTYQTWKPKRIDVSRREIVFEHNVPKHINRPRPFFAANVLEELDQPGEWYLDRSRGTLYLFPPEGFGKNPLFASMLQDTMIALSEVSHVSIRGLTLEVMRGAGVRIAGGQGCLIADCVVRHAHQGIQVSGGQDHGVVGCDLYDLDHEALRLTGGDRKTLTSAGHYAIDNHVHHYGMRLKPWQGVKLEGVGLRAAHNHVHHGPAYAIHYDGNDHVIELNEMDHVCLEMSDVGVTGTGTDWTFRGNVVRFNYIHDIPKRPYPGVCGVYLDNAVASTRIFGNVFCNLTKPVMMGGGRDHVVENNVFIDCEVPVYLDNRGLRWGHFQPRGPMYKKLRELNCDQPPWSERYPELAGILDEIPQAPLGIVVARNVSYRSGWRDPEALLRALYHSNLDRKYIRYVDNWDAGQTDPGFADAARRDFRFRRNAPVYRHVPGFRPIPFEKMGLRAVGARPSGTGGETEPVH